MKHHHELDVRVQCYVITVSDTRDAQTDKSGQKILELLKDSQGIQKVIVKDEPSQIESAVKEGIRMGANVVILNGGTGISKRDVTIETVEKLFDKKIPGFGELFRSLSYAEIGSSAILSRATAGTIGSTVVFALPGSTKAVELGLQKLIIPEMKHVISELQK